MTGFTGTNKLLAFIQYTLDKYNGRVLSNFTICRFLLGAPQADEDCVTRGSECWEDESDYEVRSRRLPSKRVLIEM